MAHDLSSGGIYILHAGKPVPRLLKEDADGILYIGKGEILDYHNRIGKFVNSLNATEVVHDGGIRFNTEAIKKVYPLEDARIEVVLTKDPVGLEKERLRKYLDEFGELPPFNRRMEE